uniref:Solute carrier family 22 member 7-like n=1 Tax=Acanthochromis polyacanthus TaxID=80966 RepID=A0A3Q1FKT5_9TELE
MFIIMRFFTGLSISGISIIAIVLSKECIHYYFFEKKSKFFLIHVNVSTDVEWFSIDHRTFAGVIISLDWTLGSFFMVAIAYCVTEWRMLILAVSSPLILATIAWRWLPESARWLLTIVLLHKRKKLRVSDQCDCVCPTFLQTLLESAETETGDKKYTFVDLFRTPNIRKLAICSGIVWYGVAFTYYGISLNISGFGLSPYLTQFIFASTEVPMKIGIYFFLEKVGRRFGQMTALLGTGLCLFINMFVSKDQSAIRTTVAVLGKSMSEASFTIIYLYTTEFYPTVVRQNGLGYTSVLARLGVSISPLIMLLEDVWHLLPAVIYCAAAVCSGLVASLLPETLNSRLPEFIEDIEKPR